MTYDAYTNNPLIHRDRRLGKRDSRWVREFACEDMSVLIVCRGPIRKEAIDVFREMGIKNIGILLSEKDSIVYPRALAPELRVLDPAHVHAIPDYTGATKEERQQRVQQMIQICRKNDYKYVFAGYGFMAEDSDFVRALENAGLKFIGPCSQTVDAAGRKDEAKRTALEVNVSVTPGINDVTARTLVAKVKDQAGLKAIAATHGLSVPALSDDKLPLVSKADAVLEAGYAKGLDLISVEELQATVKTEAAAVLAQYPGNRIRLKAIGGGGGKGQRILGDASLAPGLVLEILQEVKATGVGDNKNVLIELNIEQTRHNEIQLIGNGEWCISLGGRDCSLQMHEQKLLEVSTTQDGLAEAAERHERAGNKKQAAVLRADAAVLAKMEAEAERFGVAVKLDSASTFECIVEGTNHFFMEVNTRIQVEHRVSELCYALRFHNPADPEDYFDVQSVVEVMAILAKHKARLPKPDRIRRDAAAVEARLNATDRSLSPHAGGEIIAWSHPIEGEIRDDQGISMLNPDTGLFMRYKLAGAYDSNVALLLTTGSSRGESYARLAEVLRRTSMRGPDLATNLEFHYGLVHWFLSNGVDAKPTTRFVVPYLTLVGQLKEAIDSLDLRHAFDSAAKRCLPASKDPAAVKAAQECAVLKRTLVERPLFRLAEEPHILAAWLSVHRLDFTVKDGRVTFLRNPVALLEETYHLLHMEAERNSPAAHRIWDGDQEVLDEAGDFYEALHEHTGDVAWPELDKALRGEKPAYGFDDATWQKVRAAHAGFQLGTELLGLLALVAHEVGFYDIVVNDDLTITIPERLFDADLQKRMKKVLVPPPATKADEVVAVSGGMYYGQEGPGMPTFVHEGMHFDVGQPLYIIEVMKMFNKVPATFAGTIDKILITGDGQIVSKGQPLFKVTPDERVVDVDHKAVAKAKREKTDGLLARVG